MVRWGDENDKGCESAGLLQVVYLPRSKRCPTRYPNISGSKLMEKMICRIERTLGVLQMQKARCKAGARRTAVRYYVLKSGPRHSKCAFMALMRPLNILEARRLDESIATLESQTAHSTDLSGVTSHLPETLVSPNDTPGVFLHRPAKIKGKGGSIAFPSCEEIGAECG